MSSALAQTNAISTGTKPSELFIAKPYRLQELAERLKLILASWASVADDRSEPEPCSTQGRQPLRPKSNMSNRSPIAGLFSGT
jgi:hypothetical protein